MVQRTDERRMDEDGREPFGPFMISHAGTTHVGRTRMVNQDAFDRFDDLDRGEILLVVADGLGGHQGGETASKMAVGTLGRLCSEGDGSPRERLENAILRANAEIFKLASKDHTLRGMGTTLVAVLLRSDEPGLVAHVGDSRLYRLRGDDFAPLTEDHSVVALLVREGTISPEEAHDHPKRNQIMRALGVHEEVEIDFESLTPEAGDSLLLCSDGLHGMLRDPELKAIAERAPDAHAAVAWLVDAANQAGGTDNITAVFVRFDAADGDDGATTNSVVQPTGPARE